MIQLLIFDFPTIMTALGLKVIKSLLSVSMINYPSKQACGCEVIVNDRSIGDGLTGSSPFIKLFFFP